MKSSTVTMDNLYVHYRTARLLTHIFDEQFKVGGFRFGLDPLLDVLPVGGDILGAAISFYLIWLAIELKLPADKIAQMMGNIAFDFLLGLIPVLGIITDAAFKANVKNMQILEEYVPEQFKERKTNY